MAESQGSGTEGDAKRDDSYVVVARRYRPTTFQELIGQDQVSQALRTAITSNRVGHAYLFTGARGVGKTSTARIFGKALNCVKGPTPEPCNVCDVCRSVASGEDVDVLEIDGASNRGIEEIRQLRSTVNVRPSRGRYKVYIIDEVHMLTMQAFNALLKTLEEPPEHVKFIFCTTDPEKIPITVLSRCQRFDFPPVHVSAIQERLRQIAELEGASIEPEALALLARRAAGSMRDSQSLLEQLLAFGRDNVTVDDVHRMLGTAGGGRLASLVEAIVGRQVPIALGEIDRAILEGVDSGQLAEQLLHCFRDMLIVAHGGDVTLLNSQLSADSDKLRSLVDRWGATTTLAALQVIDQAISRMRFSMHTRVLLEMAVVRLATMADLDAVDRLARAMAKGATPQAIQAATVLRLGQSAGTNLSAAQSVGSGAGSSASPATVSSSEPDAVSKKNDRPDDSLSARASSPPNSQESSPSPLGSAEPQAVIGSRAEPVISGSNAPVTVPKKSLTSETATAIWTRSLAELPEADRGFAGDFERAAIGGPNTLVVTLRSAYNKEACERPDLRARLERAVAKVAGEAIRLEFQAIPAASRPGFQARGATPPSGAPAAAAPRPMGMGSTGPNSARGSANRRQLLRDIQRHAWVAEAMEMFEAEVLDVRPPRRPSS